MIRRGDKILVIAVLILMALGYGYKRYNDYRYRNTQGIVTIEVDGKVYGKYDPKQMKDQTFNLELPNNEHSTVEFKDGKVRIKEADCPDKVCVRTGWISEPGEIIVCLPYRIIIKVSGEKQDVDVNAF